ncbi:hypothetical protein L1887_57746 [Cichorium endivia]|nr:hypothetical protein L1887_57746 [Cichorium endivia]
MAAGDWPVELREDVLVGSEAEKQRCGLTAARHARAALTVLDRSRCGGRYLEKQKRVTCMGRARHRSSRTLVHHTRPPLQHNAHPRPPATLPRSDRRCTLVPSQLLTPVSCCGCFSMACRLACTLVDPSVHVMASLTFHIDPGAIDDPTIESQDTIIEDTIIEANSWHSHFVLEYVSVSVRHRSSNTLYFSHELNNESASENQDSNRASCEWTCVI